MDESQELAEHICIQARETAFDIGPVVDAGAREDWCAALEVPEHSLLKGRTTSQACDPSEGFHEQRH